MVKAFFQKWWRLFLVAALLVAAIQFFVLPPWLQGVFIDAGSGMGVEPGMAVLIPGGAVGRVHRTFSGLSEVILLTDSRFAADVIVERTRVRAIAEGMGGDLCRLKYVSPTQDVVPGDRVLFSGFDGSMPKGTLLGTVASVDRPREGLFLIIRGGSREPPPRPARVVVRRDRGECMAAFRRRPVVPPAGCFVPGDRLRRAVSLRPARIRGRPSPRAVPRGDDSGPPRLVFPRLAGGVFRRERDRPPPFPSLRDIHSPDRRGASRGL